MKYGENFNMHLNQVEGPITLEFRYSQRKVDRKVQKQKKDPVNHISISDVTTGVFNQQLKAKTTTATSLIELLIWY